MEGYISAACDAASVDLYSTELIFFSRNYAPRINWKSRGRGVGWVLLRAGERSIRRILLQEVSKTCGGFRSSWCI